MAFTTNLRLAQPSDARFGISAAAAAGLNWNADTLASYFTDPTIIIGIAEIRWPEQGIPNMTPAAGIMLREDGPTNLEVVLLAIDPSVLADLPGNALQRRTVIDRLLRRGIELMQARGKTTGRAQVPAGTKMAAYVESITGVSNVVDPETPLRRRYSMNLAAAVTFLQTRSG